MADGTTVGGNVDAGNDFIGRDMVEFHGVPLWDYSDTELLQNLHRAIIGNPYNAREPGLVKSVEMLADSMSSLTAWRATVDFERARIATELREHKVEGGQWREVMSRRFFWLMVLVWVTLLGVGVEAMVLIWFLGG